MFVGMEALGKVLPLAAQDVPRAQLGLILLDPPATVDLWQQEKNGADEKEAKSRKRPRTLFEWAIGREQEAEEDEEPEPIPNDRPHNTESPTTVGRGRVQLEAGYSYHRDRLNGTTIASHSFPETLLRVGMFADWFEFRIAQNFLTETQRGVENSRVAGGEDLYLGLKFALTKQKSLLPESSLVLQANVPSGQRDLTSHHFNPGLALWMGWELSEKAELEAGVVGSRATGRFSTPAGLLFPPQDVGEHDDIYWQTLIAVSLEYSLTPKL